MAIRDWLSRLFCSSGSGEQAFDRAEEEQDFEPPVDIDANRADAEAARLVGEAAPADAERLSGPDAP